MADLDQTIGDLMTHALGDREFMVLYHDPNGPRLVTSLRDRRVIARVLRHYAQVVLSGEAEAELRDFSGVH